MHDHFSLQALPILFYDLGMGFGATLTGWLFHIFGPRSVLFYQGVFTALLMLLFLGYIFGSKNLEDYGRFADSEDEDDYKGY